MNEPCCLDIRWKFKKFTFCGFNDCTNCQISMIGTPLFIKWITHIKQFLDKSLCRVYIFGSGISNSLIFLWFFHIFCTIELVNQYLLLSILIVDASQSDVYVVHSKYKIDQQAKCTQSLLVNRIPNSAFTATSHMHDQTNKGRFTAQALRVENDEYAWCPNKRVGTEATEYVEVDLVDLTVITKIAISGLLTNSGGTHVSHYFYIRYKREETSKFWRTYHLVRPNVTSLLPGSKSPLLPKFVEFDPPLITRWIRIYPYRDKPGPVCIRLEAYGCRFKDNLLHYRIPEGSLSDAPYSAESQVVKPNLPESFKQDEWIINSRDPILAGSGKPFSDTCYDGQRIEPGSLLDQGLGCLTDLNIAPTNSLPRIRASHLMAGSGDDDNEAGRNHLFVGWHRDRWYNPQKTSSNDQPVDLLFMFGSLRNFTKLKIYASNNYLDKIRLPKRITIKFSLNGLHFSGQPTIEHDFQLNNQTNGVMLIEIHLNYRVGQSVQLKLFFADDWLLLSEVTFESEKVLDAERLDTITDAAISDKSVENADQKTKVINNQSLVDNTYSNTEHDTGDADSSSTSKLSTVVILVLIVLCCFLGLFAGLACFSISWMHRKRHALNQAKAGQPHKTIIIRGADNTTLGANYLSTNGFGIGNYELNTSGGMGATQYINNKKIHGKALQNGTGLANYQLFLPNANNESPQSHNNQMNKSSNKHVLTNSKISRRLSPTPGSSAGFAGGGNSSETEAFCDGNQYRRQHQRMLRTTRVSLRSGSRSKQLATSLKALFCLSRGKTINILADDEDNALIRNPHNLVINQSQHSPVYPNTSNTQNQEFLSPGKNLGTFYTTNLTPGQMKLLTNAAAVTSMGSPVQTANGLLQIDLSQGHASMLINGQPLIRFPAQQSMRESNRNPQQWFLPANSVTTTTTNHPGSVHQLWTDHLLAPEPGVYTTVEDGESLDGGESNAASTNTPEYASTSLVHDYPKFVGQPPIIQPHQTSLPNSNIDHYMLSQTLATHKQTIQNQPQNCSLILSNHSRGALMANQNCPYEVFNIHRLPTYMHQQQLQQQQLYEAYSLQNPAAPICFTHNHRSAQPMTGGQFIAYPMGTTTLFPNIGNSIIDKGNVFDTTVVGQEVDLKDEQIIHQLGKCGAISTSSDITASITTAQTSMSGAIQSTTPGSSGDNSNSNHSSCSCDISTSGVDSTTNSYHLVDQRSPWIKGRKLHPNCKDNQSLSSSSHCRCDTLPSPVNESPTTHQQHQLVQQKRQQQSTPYIPPITPPPAPLKSQTGLT